MAKNNLAMSTNSDNGKEAVPLTVEDQVVTELQSIITENQEDVYDELEMVHRSYGLVILEAVCKNNYAHAKTQLEALKLMDNIYPNFYEQTEFFVEQAKELVYLISEKRRIVSMPHVTRTTQKRTIEHLKYHFRDLKKCVANIEKIERKYRVDDMSSTVWFVKSLYFSAIILLVFSIFWFAVPQNMTSLLIFFEDTIGYVVNFVFNQLGW